MIKAFSLFVSRDAMNIDGLSDATLEKFIAEGFIRSFDDIYHLDRYEDEITGLEGFGKKSYDNLINAVETSRTTNLARLIYALGIPGIGVANAKVLDRFYDHDMSKIMEASAEELSAIEGMGDVLAGAINSFMSDERKRELIRTLMSELRFEESEVNTDNDKISGKTFVITGSLVRYTNRDELKAEIEALNGKVAGSVSNNTAALINNDVTSNSAKNKKAKELGIPIVSEEDFIKEYLGKDIS
jgi:DNA ligase (NAD+)